MSQLSFGVREILEIHTQLFGQLEILLARWDQVGFPISYLIVRLLLMVENVAFLYIFCTPPIALLIGRGPG